LADSSLKPPRREHTAPAAETGPPLRTPAEAQGSSVGATGKRQTDLFAANRAPETLEQIQQDLGRDCRRCKLWQGRKSIVFGSGNPHAELVFVGEGPGADEDEQGLPFVGRAGQLLTDMIEKGLKIPRPDVYICNIVKCRPPGNRKPERDEIAACREFVERQIDSIRPSVICALGSTAAETLLDVKQSMSSLRGRWYEFHGLPLIVTYHPAFLLRDPSRKAETWEDLKMIRARLRTASDLVR
jgi:DNA polymerase